MALGKNPLAGIGCGKELNRASTRQRRCPVLINEGELKVDIFFLSLSSQEYKPIRGAIQRYVDTLRM